MNPAGGALPPQPNPQAQLSDYCAFCVTEEQEARQGGKNIPQVQRCLPGKRHCKKALHHPDRYELRQTKSAIARR